MLHSFSLGNGTIEKYHSIIPVSKSKRIFKDFLLNDYELPNELDGLEVRGNDIEIHVMRLGAAEMSKIENLLLTAKNRGTEISKSALMRDIFKQLIATYEDKDLQPIEYHRQTFKVPVGTKERLSRLVKDRTRAYELSRFIMDEYKPSNSFPSMRGKEQEGFDFKADINVFGKMDDIADEFGFKKGGRAKIFRDALTQFEQYLNENPLLEKEVELKLQNVIEEYKHIEDKSVIKEKITKYLDE